MTRIDDIKKANSNAHRSPYQITQANMTHASTVGIWLRELALLEAHIRRYATEHGVKVPA